MNDLDSPIFHQISEVISFFLQFQFSEKILESSSKGFFETFHHAGYDRCILKSYDYFILKLITLPGMTSTEFSLLFLVYQIYPENS